MSMPKPKPDKPGKPFKEFPLFAHATGQWCRKIHGKFHYFGKWDNPDAALEEYMKQRDYLYAGLTPPHESKTLYDLIEAFKTDKLKTLEAGKINERTYKEYCDVGDIIATLGKNRPIESLTPHTLRLLSHKLAIGKNGQPVSPVTHKRLLTFARMVFKFANDYEGANIKYLQPLAPPEKRLIREQRAKRGKLLYGPAVIRKLLQIADPHLQAMIYLAINCGFGPADIIRFPSDAVDGNFHNFPRPKTSVERRAYLWPETRKALAALDANGVQVFNGRVWNRHIIARQFSEICDRCGVKNLGFYSLRRTFETVAKNSGVNQSVINRIMGHESPTMDEVYNQMVFDKQLVKCANFVRDWLSGKVRLS